MSLFEFIHEIIQNKRGKTNVVSLSEGVDAILPGYSQPKIDPEFLYGVLAAKDIEIVN